MIADTWLLLQLRWQLTWNGWRHRRLSRKLLYLLGLGFMAFMLVPFSASIGYGSAALVEFMGGSAVEHLMPGLILTAATVLLLLSAFGIALGSLFFSSDLDLLMAAPVDRRAVLVAKLLEGVLWYYALLAVTALPAMVLYGWRLRYQFWYYPLTVFVLIGAPLLTAGIGALAVMLVARFAPARRVREVLGFVAAIFGLSCSLLGQSTRLWVDRLESLETNPQAVLDSVERLANLPIPTFTAGRGLVSAGHGAVGSGLLAMLLFLVLTFGFFALCVWLADRLYASGWTRMQSAGSARRDRKRGARGGFLATAPASLTIPLKDWRIIPRDLRNFAQLLAPLIIIPIVYLNIVNGPRNRSGEDVLLNYLNRLDIGSIPITLTEIGIAGSILFIAALVFTRIALTGISMEGRSWWLLKAAPISAWEILRGKFLAAYVPFAIVNLILLAGAAVWRQFGLLTFVYCALGTLLLGVGIMALCVGLSVPWARLDWDDPRRMSSGWGGLIAFILEVIYLSIGLGFWALPALAYTFRPEWAGMAWFIGITGAIVITAIVSLPPLAFGARRMGRVGDA